VGNELLREIAGMIRQTVRMTDIIARFGVDEFAILLPQTSEEQGVCLAETE
jgi:diguanylate cyclase (GGDEF)-like protein